MLTRLSVFTDHEGEAGITRETVQNAMFDAQATVGLHLSQGHEVWQLCREITSEQIDESDDHDGKDRDLLKEQALRELFSRQMQLPLLENDLVMSEFRAWNAYNTLEPDASLREQVFEKAESIQTKSFGPFVKKLKGFEEQVPAEVDDNTKLVEGEQAWVKYINFVKHRIAPLLPSDDGGSNVGALSGRRLVICLFERAIAALCLHTPIWFKYLDYLGSSTKNSSLSDRLELCRRAVRNVSFDSEAWIELLLTMESQGGNAVIDITEYVQTRLLTPTDQLTMDQFHYLHVLLTFCDIHRRSAASTNGYSQQSMETLDAVFTACETFMESAFPEFPLGWTRLLEYHSKAWLLVKCPDHVKKAKWQTLWQQILEVRGQNAEVWATYYQESLRSRLMSTAEIRSTCFRKAIKSVQDYLSSVTELWVTFEREHGDLEGLLEARRLHTKLLTSASTAVSEHQPEIQTEDNSSTTKRKRGDSTHENRSKSKRTKHQTHDVSVETSAPESQAPTTVSKPDRVEKKRVHETFTNEFTLFVSNLSKQTTREDIEVLFADISGLKDVRLVGKNRGDRVKSRGMAYVQFSGEDGVAAGLSRDGQIVHGQTISVKLSEPPVSVPAAVPKQPSAKASKAQEPASTESGNGLWKMDPRTIYVGGLNSGNPDNGDQVAEVADDDELLRAIQRALSSAGESIVITRTSILKDKRGRPKNYGLVELADAEQATACLSRLADVQGVLGSQVSMKPSRFSIAQILEQQHQQQQQQQQVKRERGKQSGNKPKPKPKPRVPDAAPHERPSRRLALGTTTTSTTSASLLPRALRSKKKADDAATTSAEPGKPMTNDDFRQLLLKK